MRGRYCKSFMSQYDFLYDTPDVINSDDYHHKPNIVKAAAKIMKKLVKKREVVCCAQMQSGKTDVMKRLIYLVDNYRKKLEKMGVKISRKNIHLIICISSVNLKKQLQSKLPEITNRIYHLNDLTRMIKDMETNVSEIEYMANHGLILFDECHSDAHQNSIVSKLRFLIKYISKYRNTRFKCVGFSATPYEQVLVGFPKVVMKPSQNYYGLMEMFNQINVPIVYQAKDLSSSQECSDLFEEIFVGNYYYIFRLPSILEKADSVVSNIEIEMKKRKIRFDSYIYDMYYQDDLNNLLSIEPKKPIIIYIKDKLRMGEYLNTKYVYLVHDDLNNQYTHTTAQSLIGRCCGYNKSQDRTIIYCDYDKAWQHYQWIRSGYSVKRIPRHAKYIDNSINKTKSECIY